MSLWNQAGMDTVLREILATSTGAPFDVYHIAQVVETLYPAVFAILNQPRGGYESGVGNSLPQYLGRVGLGRINRGLLTDVEYGTITVLVGTTMAQFPDGGLTRASTSLVSTFHLVQV